MSAPQQSMPSSPLVAQPFFPVDGNGNPIASGNPLAVVTASVGSALALTSPPAQTNAGSDTVLTFAAQAKHWLVQNNTSANVYIELDAVASTSSTLLSPGIIWREDIPVTAIHVYTAAAQNVNGTSGIVVKGWA